MKLFISNAILRHENKKLKQEIEAYKAMILATQDDYISLRAERDALAKSICVVSEPIETIQPRGIVE